MKYGRLFRLNLLIFMLAFSAGLIFFACGFSCRLPKDVRIDGVEVGGKSRAEAVRIVRGETVAALKEKALIIEGKKKYVFTYPEIGYKDNLQRLVKDIKRGGSYSSEVSYYLNGLKEIAGCICAEESAPVTEPYAVFNKEGAPFTYFAGSDGARADGDGLVSDIKRSLAGGFEAVKIRRVGLPRKTSMADVKAKTRLISAFTTYFDASNTDRAHNIRLAAEKINGSVIEKGGSFSFNATVGERSAARGFKAAKIIEKGEFVEGIGGGVCQVSTTLYNAALLSGCKICEYHPHSLAVGYVPPSCDAMVSGTYYDLKFTNALDDALYIRARAGEGYITFCFYGKSDGAQYSYASRVTGGIPAPEEITQDEALAKDGRDGILSEGYLTVTRNGLKKTVLYRKDKYLPVKRVVYDGQAESGDGEAQP